MIRQLRVKLVAITMVLLMVMLVVILGCVYHLTRAGLEGASLSTLQAVNSDRGGPGKPGKPLISLGPCFVLELSPNGKLTALGSDYYHLEDPELLKAILDEAQETGLRTGVLKNRTLRFLELDGGPGSRYAFTDITSEMQTLQRLNFTCVIILFTGLLGFLVISILLARWAVRPVETAWEQQRQFVADASHELKTPLTVILTNAELLQSDEYDEPSKRRFADSILTMSHQMRGLVEQLLNQARVDSGKVQSPKVRTNLSKLVSDAVLPFEPVYFEAGRELQSAVEPDIQLSCHPTQLRQVVDILLDNGCKYSTPGSMVTLNLSRPARSHCILQVSSPGVPMTEQQCRDIFQRFYRADEARSMNRSYGLGLSIAEGIVHQHRGKIWAQSRDGINTFFVSLPL